VSDGESVLVAKPIRFGELFAVGAGLILWMIMLVGGGLKIGLETAWLPAIVLPLAVWTLGMRLRLTPDSLSRDFSVGRIGRRTASLPRLESIEWRRTGGVASGGTMMVRDAEGHCVPVYADRFSQRTAWGPRLLAAADRAGAQVDGESRQILSESAEDYERQREA
jgi:hypothetical protein